MDLQWGGHRQSEIGINRKPIDLQWGGRKNNRFTVG